jgi:phosphoglycolate phosphatase-like HAD superfamily hydrolase
MPAEAASFPRDSTTDIQAAYAADAMSTGYTNKPGKTAQLIAADADTVIPSPGEITEQLT